MQKVFLRENVLVYFFSLAVIAGPALHVLFQNDLSQQPDTSTYLSLARFDFDESPVRRYRLIIPMLAALVDNVTGFATERLAPSHYKGDFSLAFSFFMVNTLLVSVLSVLTYLLCRVYGISRPFSLVGILALLTSRYTAVFAALPLVDSLYCVAVAIALLGVKTKNVSLIIGAIFLGPLARESFLFVAPVVFFFSHLSTLRLIALFMVSGMVAFALHYIYDLLYPPYPVGWLQADLAHVYNLGNQVRALFSFYGIYKIMINLGIWILLPVSLMVFVRGAKGSFFPRVEGYIPVFLILVLVQMLLSGSMERIFFQAMPLFAVLTGYSAEKLWRSGKMIRTKPPLNGS